MDNNNIYYLKINNNRIALLKNYNIKIKLEDNYIIHNNPNKILNKINKYNSKH
jgi:hypothetical protein